ncbi:hypothetical protein Y032_0120g928 [Ancylostoma ceylanicum]|nr:hypothetical protein Y032_0120g928 [Ancylostoma ceylanicum]
MEKIVEFLEHFSGLVGDHKELAEPPTPEEQKSKSKIVPMRKSATSAKHSAFAKMRKKNKNYEAPRKTEISQDESYSKRKSSGMNFPLECQRIIDVENKREGIENNVPARFFMGWDGYPQIFDHLAMLRIKSNIDVIKSKFVQVENNVNTSAKYQESKTNS